MLERARVSIIDHGRNDHINLYLIFSDRGGKNQSQEPFIEPFIELYPIERESLTKI